MIECGMRFLKRLGNFVFQSYYCDIYDSTLIQRNEADFLPTIGNYSFTMVTTEQQLDDLESSGFKLSQIDSEARSMLQRGAAAGLLFVDRELVSMEWVATNDLANKAINIYPLKINFLQKEAYASGVWTNPRFRRKGLHIYVYYKVYDFLRINDIEIVKSIVATDNIAARKAHERFAPQEKIIGRAHYWRILGIQFWSEGFVDQKSNAKLLGRLPSMPNV
jgi:hypothetical protein